MIRLLIGELFIILLINFNGLLVINYYYLMLFGLLKFLLVISVI